MADIISDLNVALARITALEGENAAHAGNITTLTGQLETSTASLADMTTQRDTLSASLGAEQGAHAATRNELGTSRAEVTRLTGEARTVEQRVMEITGKGGNKPAKPGNGDANPTDKPKTSAEALAAYNALTDSKERAEYYKEHKALMFPKR